MGRSGKFAFVDGLSSLFSQGKTALGRPAVKGKRVLHSAKLPDVQRELDAAILDVSAADARTILVLDQPDVLLAASSEDLDGLSLRNMLRDVQEVSEAPSADPPPLTCPGLYFVIFIYVYVLCHPMLDYASSQTHPPGRYPSSDTKERRLTHQNRKSTRLSPPSPRTSPSSRHRPRRWRRSMRASSSGSRTPRRWSSASGCWTRATRATSAGC